MCVCSLVQQYPCSNNHKTDSVRCPEPRAPFLFFPRRLKAAGAYAYATSGGTATGGGDFCRQNFLHAPTMDRSLQLRRQLSRLVDLRFGTEPGWKDCDLAGALRPPSRRQSDALRQVSRSGVFLLADWCCCRWCCRRFGCCRCSCFGGGGDFTFEKRFDVSSVALPSASPQSTPLRDAPAPYMLYLASCLSSSL